MPSSPFNSLASTLPISSNLLIIVRSPHLNSPCHPSPPQISSSPFNSFTSALLATSDTLVTLQFPHIDTPCHLKYPHHPSIPSCRHPSPPPIPSSASKSPYLDTPPHLNSLHHAAISSPRHSFPSQIPSSSSDLFSLTLLAASSLPFILRPPHHAIDIVADYKSLG